jgi:hypothetical protein
MYNFKLTPLMRIRNNCSPLYYGIGIPVNKQRHSNAIKHNYFFQNYKGIRTNIFVVPLHIR